ncbi:MAG TPA: helix-turn-helix transcriptional regulator, partial [Pyrinomonadaceae bacterium]|nr:helix-turn-helix transcriptional regulator [Pyrinomonadaceae bacterium]
MGTRARQRPERLAEKLLAIRNALGISQPEMLRRLNAEDTLTYNKISEFETGRREPSLIILLRYARVSGVPADVLIDDELDLPENLPGPTRHEQMTRKFARRTGK